MVSDFRVAVEKAPVGSSLSSDVKRSNPFSKTLNSKALNSNFRSASSFDPTQTVSRGGTPPKASLLNSTVTTRGATTHTFTVVYRDPDGIRRRTINARDLLVTGPNGFRQLATLDRKPKLNKSGTRATATYRIAAAGGSWDLSDNGAYVVSVQRRQVSDNKGNFIKPRRLGSGFQVNIPNQSPIASLGLRRIEPNAYTFDVTYSDETAINASSLSGDDIRVTGPSGFNQLAQLVGITPTGNGTPLTATYKITAPTETWNAANDGTYTVSLLANQVVDTFGAAAAAGNLGTFVVDSTKIPPSATLSANNITITGASTYDFTVTYIDNEVVNVSTLDSNDIRVTGPNGFNQAAAFVEVDANANGASRTATYRINAPGGRWDGPDAGTYTVILEPNQVSDALSNFTPAGTLGTFAVTIEQAAPTATLAESPKIVLDSGSANILVNYADNAAVDISTLDARDLRVTGPNGFDQLAKFVRADSNANSASVTATYRIDAPGGIWDGAAAANGLYTMTLQNGQIGDANANLIGPTSLGSFQVQLSSFSLEAERMTLSNYVVETTAPGLASGDQLIRLNATSATNVTGTATTTFTGPSGVYDLAIRYVDESDGISGVEVRVDGALAGKWNFDKDLGSGVISLQNFTHYTLPGIAINQNSQIQITGLQITEGVQGGEAARLDRIDFIPKVNGSVTLSSSGALIAGVGDNTLTANNGINTVDYSHVAKGIIANLGTGTVLKPIYGALNTPQIMPFGDSLTGGEHNETPTYPGGYRVQLVSRLSGDGLSVDFVGSQTQANAPISDKNYELTPGSINDTLAIVNTPQFTTYGTDVVLLMVGTVDTSNNNSLNRPLETMQADLTALINRLTEQLPSAEILVASVPPVASPPNTTNRVDRISDYNDLIPGVVASVAAAGRNVRFVDVNSGLTTDDLLPGSGVNLKSSGHTKIGNLWYNALVDEDTLVNIQNIVGTGLNDTLSGNNGNNLLEGGGGSDRLTGGGGADTFVYRSPNEGGDTITGFSATDFIQISASGFGSGLVSGTNLSNGAASPTGVFVLGNTPVGTGANFLYNGGTLRYDPDGVGAAAAVTIATLSGAPAFNANQIRIVS